MYRHPASVKVYDFNPENTKKIISVKKTILNRGAPRVPPDAPRVAVHGIQRSGTNFLCEFLFKSGIGVINYPDPERDNPRHKHFRWYSNKEAIPTVIKHQYGNKVVVDSLAELNELCQYPTKTFHFVVVKDKQKWIISILNWGLRCKWFDSVDDAIGFIHQFVQDYENYYQFWRSLEESCPDNVRLVSVESIIEDVESFNLFLSEICDLRLIPGFNGVFDELPQSPAGRKTYFTRDDLDRIQSVMDLIC